MKPYLHPLRVAAWNVIGGVRVAASAGKLRRGWAFIDTATFEAARAAGREREALDEATSRAIAEATRVPWP